MPTPTTTYALSKPTVGGDDNAWGTEINSALDKIDDLFDGTTAIKPNLDAGLWKVGGVAVTSSAAELNVLDGIPATLTATELGYVDGVTSAIQTQLNAKQASDATLTSLSGLSLAAGDVLYATAADTVQRLAIGTAGQLLSVNSGATAPQWATVSTESIVLLGSVNTTSGSTQTLSGLNLTGYKQVQAWGTIDPSTTSTLADVAIAGLSVLITEATSTSFFAVLDLGSGLGWSPDLPAPDVAAHTLTAASTSISVTTTQTFASGSVRFYGVK